MVEKHDKVMEPISIKIERDICHDLIQQEDPKNDARLSQTHPTNNPQDLRNNRSKDNVGALNAISTPAATPSPPSRNSPPSLQPLFSTPPAGAPTSGPQLNGTRPVNIVKRFLTTLQQFAKEISPEVGSQVRTLILNLLNGTISFEQFHTTLQEVTHFPLRPFVLPFLRSHLPYLLRDLQSQAKKLGISLSQYITFQELNILDVSAVEAADIFSEGISKKRKAESSSEYENNSTATLSSSLSTTSGFDGLDAPSGESVSPPHRKKSPLFSFSCPSATPGLDIGIKDSSRPLLAGPDNEWKNIHVMLTCILSMVEKTRRALTILQQKEDRDQTLPNGTLRGCSDGKSPRADCESAEIRRCAAEMVAQAIKANEEKVEEVKHKAEEAVNEVRKAAISEIQRAVAGAESRAQELVLAERCRFDEVLREILKKRDAAEDCKTDPLTSCWCCRKKAQDTCSGCSVAKYCSASCQHKDWENHHRICSTVAGGAKVNGRVQKSSDQPPKME